MGILGILMAVTILVINPAEYLRRARDTNRLSDLNTLKTALTLYTVDTGNDYSTTDNTVYVSLPDSSSTCATWGLPALPSPWVYKCVTTANYRKADGTGWVPINLASMASKPLSTLPVDPTNNLTYYYTFVMGGSFELNAITESTQGATNASSDGGVDPAMVEVGTNLSLSPFTHGLVGYWRFDDGTGLNAVDSSGMGNNGTLTNGPAWTTGKVGGALSFDGTDDYVQKLIPVGLSVGTQPRTITAWIKPTLACLQQTVTSAVKYGTGAELQNFLFGLNHTQIALFGHGSGDVITSVSVASDVFSSIVVVYDGASLRFYKNGDLIYGPIAKTYNTIIDSNGLLIGVGNGLLYPFNGLIDEVRIYNRALSAAEVLAQYNATK